MKLSLVLNTPNAVKSLGNQLPILNCWSKRTYLEESVPADVTTNFLGDNVLVQIGLLMQNSPAKE